MNLYAELEAQKAEAQAQAHAAGYEYAVNDRTIRALENRNRDLLVAIEASELRIKQVELTMRQFNSYLAIEKGALDLDDVLHGVEEKTPIETGGE